MYKGCYKQTRTAKMTVGERLSDRDSTKRDLILKEAAFVLDNSDLPEHRRRFCQVAVIAAEGLEPEEISGERGNQNRQWGGPAHDDAHTTFEFRELIEKQAALIVDGDENLSRNRGRFIKIAALAKAIVESIDRRLSAAI